MTYNIGSYKTLLVRERTSKKQFVCTNPEEVANLLIEELHLDQSPQEQFYVVYLNVKNIVVGFEQISKGSRNTSPCNTFDVFRGAIATGCSAIILAHNHPSGDPTPSDADTRCTQQLIKAGDIIGIRVIDHIVLGDGRYLSMRDAGLIQF